MVSFAEIALERLYERLSERFEKIPLAPGRPREERGRGRPSQRDVRPLWRVIELSIPDSWRDVEDKLFTRLEEWMDLPPGLFNDLKPRRPGPRPKVPSLMGPPAPPGESTVVLPPSKGVMLEWIGLVRRRSRTRRRVRRFRHSPRFAFDSDPQPYRRVPSMPSVPSLPME